MSARQTIIEAGLRVFLAHGYDGAGMAQILTASGVSRGGFYHHFPGKLALFEQVINLYMPSPLASMDVTAHGALDAAAQKRAIAEFYQNLQDFAQGGGAESSGDLTRYYALFFDALSHLPRYRLEIARAYSGLIAMLAAALERDAGVSPAEARHEARATIAAFEGETYLWAVTRTSPVEQKEM